MKIIAGLGNPGDKHKGTRHNAGYMAVEALALRHGISGKFESKFNSITGKGRIKDCDTLIIQPMTYMNLSGEAVAKVINWYKLEVSDLLVIYDDMSLDLGVIRFRPDGSDGSHNGLKSIISCLGTQKFDRLKIGIGPNPGGHLWTSFVLEKFSPAESELLKKVINLSVEAAEECILSGMGPAQNKFNGIDLRDAC